MSPPSCICLLCGGGLFSKYPQVLHFFRFLTPFPCIYQKNVVTLQTIVVKTNVIVNMYLLME